MLALPNETSSAPSKLRPTQAVEVLCGSPVFVSRNRPQRLFIGIQRHLASLSGAREIGTLIMAVVQRLEPCWMYEVGSPSVYFLQ